MSMFKKQKKIRYEVRQAIASRAIVQEGRGHIPKIEMRFETYDGEILEFDLDFEQAATFIDQAAAAYNAVLRPLKTSRGSSN